MKGNGKEEKKRVEEERWAMDYLGKAQAPMDDRF